MSTDKASDHLIARDNDEIPDEIDFSHGVRGKYAERFKDGFTIRIVSDEEDRRRQARRAAETDAELTHSDDEGQPR